METVGIQEMKAHLGDYVGRARQGERLIITDRGREVAELAPLSQARRAVMALERAGKVRWNGGKPSGLRGITVRGAPVAETVVEDRR